MMTRRLLCLLAACLCIGILSAQTNKTIRELESRRGALQRQISESEKLLQTTRKDVGSQLQGLATLTGQMEERKRYILALNNDLETIDRELSALDRRTKALQQDLKEKREEYAASVRYQQAHSSIQEKLLFILSAESLAQTYRRLRYAREFAAYLPAYEVAEWFADNADRKDLPADIEALRKVGEEDNPVVVLME